MITFETIAYVCFSCDVTKSNRNQKGIKSTLYIESLNYTDQNIENNILTNTNYLKTYFEKKTEGAIIRSKACWLREGERNSKFLILEFRHHPEKICQLNEHLNYLLFLYLNKVSCKICVTSVNLETACPLSVTRV
jgi:hypothetical protein